MRTIWTFVAVLSCLYATAQCPANFNIPASITFCSNQAVILTNNSGTVDSSKWTWSGMNNGSQPGIGSVNFNNTLAQAGTTTICLKVYSGTCTDSTCRNLTIVAAPSSPSFTFTPLTPCSGTPITFTVSSPQPSPVTYSWSFQGGGTGSGNSAIQSFTATGGNSTTGFNSTLTINKNGCSSSTSQAVNVKQQPLAILSDPINTFKFCAGGTANLMVYDGSTPATNSNYIINWGDGSANYNNSTEPSGITHNYQSGVFHLLYTVTGVNGCVGTFQKLIYNITNPQIGAANPGNTQGCSPKIICFPLNTFAGNDSSTTYVVDFGDGSPTQTYNHPPPDTVCHNYTITSCGRPGNAYTFKVTAGNGCDTSIATISPVKVYTPPVAEFSIVPNPGCVNSPIRFNNNTSVGTNASCDTTTLYTWNFGDGSSNVVTPSKASQTHTYTSGGTYVISLSAMNGCGTSPVTHTVCIQTPPSPAFTALPLTGCTPLIVNLADNSTGINQCGSITRSWGINQTSFVCAQDSVSDFNYLSGTSSSSALPVVQFNNQGLYNVTLALTNVCGTFTTPAQIVTVKRKPLVSLTGIAANLCVGQNVTPAGNVQSCLGTISQYAWSFPNGNPASSSNAAAPNVSYNSSSTNSISLSVTNECGTSTATSLINILGSPVAAAGVDRIFCSGRSASLGSASAAGISYIWSPATGLSSTNISNPTIQLTNGTSSPVIYNYIVTATNAAGCFSKDTVLVTVNPLPVISINPSAPAICPGSSVKLTATGAMSYTWSPAAGLSGSNGDTVNAHPLVSTIYTVTGTDVNNCSATASVNVRVNPAPAVSAGRDTIICNQPIPVQLTGTPAGGTWSGVGITSTGSFTPSTIGVFTEIYNYTDANSCGNKDTAIVTVIAPSTANAGRDTVICEASGTLQLTGVPAAGIWSGSSQITSTGLFSTGTSGVFTLTYTYGTGSCANSDNMTVSVNPRPVIPVSPSYPFICIGNSIRLTASGAITYSWSPVAGLSSGSGDTVNAHPVSSATYTVTGTNTNGCTASNTINVTVNPLPAVSAGRDTQLCNQPISIQLSGTPNGGSWSGPGISTSGNFTPSAVGTFTEYYLYTDPNTCFNNDSMIISVISPSPAYAGRDSAVCQFSPSVQLLGSPTGGSWSGSSFITVGGLMSTNIPGIYSLVYTYGTGTCANRDTVIVTIKPQPAISINPNNSSICTGSSVRLTASGGVIYSWSPGTGLSGLSGDTVNAHPLSSISYSVTGTDIRGCTASASINLSVNQLPAVSAGRDTQVCNQAFSTQLAGLPSGGTWSGSGITPAGSFTPPGVGSYTEYYSYSDGNTCTNRDSMIITVISPNPANAGRDTAICQFTSNLQLQGFPAGGSWSGNNVNSSGIFTTAMSGTFTLTYTYGSGSCLTTDDVVVIVNPVPSLTITPISPSICKGDSVTLQVSGADAYIWSPAIGFSNSTTASINAHPLVTTTYYVEGTFALTGCKRTDSTNIQVTPLPEVTNNPLIQTVCSGNASSAVILTSSISNTTFSWTTIASTGLSGYSGSGTSTIPSQTISNSDTSYHYVFYTITPLANGCPGPKAFDTIKVNPLPFISLPPDQTICSGDNSIAAHITSGISQTLIQWTGNAVTGITGYTISGTGDIPAQHLINSTSAASNVTYSVSDTLNGCGGPSLNYSITVNPSPTIQFSRADEVICSGSSSSPVNLSAIPSGSSITWTAVIPSGIVGAASSGTTSIPSMVLTNTTNQPQIIVYQAQAATTNVICPGTVSTYRITINPTPSLVVSNVSDTICSSTAIVSGFTSPVAGTVFTWTAHFTSQVTGASGGTGDSILQTLVNSDSISRSGFYIISTSAAGCPGMTDSVFVTVNPSPLITFSIPDQTICSGNVTQLVTILSSTPGASISWSASAPTAITGFMATGSNTIPAQQLTNSGSNIETVNYQVTTSFNGCAGVSNQYNVTVNPTPHVLNTDTLQIICSGNNLAAINLLSDVSGALFSWSATGPATASGFSTLGTTAIIPAQVILNSSNSPDTIVYSIIPTANNCMGSLKIIKIIVRPLPQITLTPDSQKQCSGFNSVPITITSSIPGTLYNWYGVALNVSGIIMNDSTPTIPAMMLLNNSPVADTGLVHFTVQPRAAGCPGNVVTAFIEVDPDPIANFAIAQTILCSPSPVVIASNGLVFGNPDSLVINWGDGSSSIVHPNPGQPAWSNSTHLYSNPGFVPDTFIITLTAFNHCSDSSISKPVIVLPNTINAFFNSSVSQGCAPLAVTFTDFSSGGNIASWCFEYDTLSRICTGAGQVVPLHSAVSHTFGPGTHIVALFVNDGCSFDTVFHAIQVYDSTSANFSFNDNVCEGSVVRFIDSSLIATGSFVTGYQWTFGDYDSSYTQSPSHIYDTTGALSACLTITSSFGCNSSICKPVHIYFAPVAAFADTNICINSQPSSFQNNSQGASFYLWDFGDGNTANTNNPQHVYVDSGSYSVTLIASTNQCADTSKGTITIYPKPHSQFILPANYSCGLPSILQPVNQSSGATGYSWNFGNSLSSSNFNPTAQYIASGNYTIRLIASNIYHCFDTSERQIEVYPYPQINSVLVDPAEGCQPLMMKITTDATYALAYEWNFGDGSGILTSPTNDVVHTYYNTGRFTITAYAYSNAACGDTITLTDTVNVHVRPTANFTFVPDSAIYPVDGTVIFTNSSANAQQYVWDFSDGTTTVETDPRHRFESVSTFEVILVAISDFGCRDTAVKSVDVLKKALYVPNALSPDYGGYDTLVKIWKPIGIGLRTYRAAVYDKWGKLLWQSTELLNTQPSEGWNGTYNGDQCIQDVYVWKVDAIFLDGQIWQGMSYSKDEGGGTKRIGSITLIR